MNQDQFSSGALVEGEPLEVVQTFSNADLRTAINHTASLLERKALSVSYEKASELLLTHLGELLKIERLRAGIVCSIEAAPIIGGTTIINNHG